MSYQSSVGRMDMIRAACKESTEQYAVVSSGWICYEQHREREREDISSPSSHGRTHAL